MRIPILYSARLIGSGIFASFLEIEYFMLTKRIIPCLDVDKGRVVKGVSFVDLRDAGSPAEMASFYDQAGADELVFLDITASSSNRNTMRTVVEEVSERVFIPLTVGGGIRQISDMIEMLEAGCDKVSVNTAAIKDPTLIKDASKYFGSQCIVCAIDAKRVLDLPEGHSDILVPDNGIDSEVSLDEDSHWEVYTHGGRIRTGIDAVKWCSLVNSFGAGEILLTSMDTDGHEAGYDLELLSAVSEVISVPLIASGGAGNLVHLKEAIDIGGADAVLAASIFHFGTYTVSEAKAYLRDNDIPIRP